MSVNVLRTIPLCFRFFLFLGAHSWGAEGVGIRPEHHGVASTPARSTFFWPIRFALEPSQLRLCQRNRQRHHQSESLLKPRAVSAKPPKRVKLSLDEVENMSEWLSLLAAEPSTDFFNEHGHCALMTVFVKLLQPRCRVMEFLL